MQVVNTLPCSRVRRVRRYRLLFRIATVCQYAHVLCTRRGIYEIVHSHRLILRHTVLREIVGLLSHLLRLSLIISWHFIESFINILREDRVHSLLLQD